MMLALTFQHLVQDVTLVIFCILATVVLVGPYVLKRLQHRERTKDQTPGDHQS